MGTDLTVVNAARVSFHKQHDEFQDNDERLIRFLARNGHWTPFGHPHITLRMTAPIFVRTQCFKHKVGFVENEVSRRYVDEDPTFYGPNLWRERAESAKQGSGWPLNKDLQDSVTDEYRRVLRQASETYNRMLGDGVCPEQARMVLPQSMMTQWYWTGSLMAYARFCCQRLDGHAQEEIRDLAAEVSTIIQPLFPVSWHYLVEDEGA